MEVQLSQIVAYEKKGNGAVILRCFSNDSRAEIPERLGDLPVVGLAPYAFSGHMPETILADGFRRGTAFLAECGGTAEENMDFDSLPPALCAGRLKELVLPSNVRSVGRYCFYNCENLEYLEFPGTLYDWGTGVFTGCHQIRRLSVHMDADEDSGLKQVLDEIREDLFVGLFCGDSYARLVFPEFYEEGVENTPARILETHVHGSGILYRNCFQGRKFDFAQYDSLFPYAKAQENAETVMELVLSRLRYPFHLGETAGRDYREYLFSHALEAGRYFLDQGDEEGFAWYLDQVGSLLFKPVREMGQPLLLDALSAYAARIGAVQAQSRIMELRGRAAAPKRRHLDL